MLVDTTFKPTAIMIQSYASPDGDLKWNTELSNERTESGFNLVKDVLKKNPVNSLTDEKIIKKPDLNGEDWAGLKNLVGNSTMTGKDEVMGIINSNLNFDEKEASLRKLPTWGDLKANYLTKLRRTEVIVAGTFPNRPFEEVASLINQNKFQGLTKKEIIMYANKVANVSDKEKAYKYLMEQYPEDWAGVNNYAALLLSKGDNKGADSILTLAHAKYPDNDTITSNLGVAKSRDHKFMEAQNLFDRAAKSVKENNNLAILYLKNGNYDNSVNNFDQNKCDYNTALAYALNGDE
jgi:tetratricopeptide (TPR) repeat protein